MINFAHFIISLRGLFKIWPLLKEMVPFLIVPWIWGLGGEGKVSLSFIVCVVMEKPDMITQIATIATK